MSRPLPALVVIAAALIGGVWIQAASRGSSEPAPAPAEVAGPIAATTTPSTDAKSPARSSDGFVAPATIASLDATPVSAVAPPAASPDLGAAARIGRDPLTGQIIAPEHSGPVLTVEQMQDLARQEAQGLITIRNPDGSETLNHEGRFTAHTVVRIGPDGKPVFKCVHGESGVEHALHHGTPVITKTEDR